MASDSVTPTRPPCTRAWDLSNPATPDGICGAIDKAMAALPPGSTVVAALAGPPAGDRLARELSVLAARHSQVRFERHTVRIDRDKSVSAHRRYQLPALPSHDRGR
ncbi:MAG: hypothetical protein M3O46_01180 [Myxococcota bacterium]|nr:hypothetical protein [Myxococcota bacterium]